MELRDATRSRALWLRGIRVRSIGSLGRRLEWQRSALFGRGMNARALDCLLQVPDCFSHTICCNAAAGQLRKGFKGFLVD